MPYSSTIGASRGTKRTGRWFVLVFLCMVLILAVVPAVSLGSATPKCFFQFNKVTLSASRSCVASGTAVKLTARAIPCPKNGTFTLYAKNSAGVQTTVGTAPAGSCGTAVFTVTPVRNMSYQVTLTANGIKPVSSCWTCVKVCAKLTLCVTPGQYCGLAISGTLVPGWPGGKVTVTICQYINCWHTMKVATLTATLHQGSGDSSTYAVNWTGKHCTKYTISACVPTTADFKGACVSSCFTL